MAVEDLDAADVDGVDTGLVRDRADDVAGLNAVLVADLDAVADELDVFARGTRGGRSRRGSASGGGLAAAALGCAPGRAR